MDRDQLDTIFNTLKDVSKEAEEKSSKLERNRAALADKEGNIPKNYEKAFTKLENEVKDLNNRLDSGETVMLRLVSAYVKENAMGNLVYEDNNDGTKYFNDVYTELFDQNWNVITKAINAFDLVGIDKVIQGMREKFLAKTFSRYCEYAKTLSFNK